MSSWIVEDKTIHRLMTLLDDEDKNDKMFRKLLKMNIDATEQRYTTPYLTPEQKKLRLKNSKYEFIEVSKMQALKSLCCFLYQCSEGTIPDTRLYKNMTMIKHRSAEQTINDLKEYDEAEWG